MLFDPNVLYLGSEDANDARKIVFVDGALGAADGTDGIDPSTLSQLWSIDVGSDDFVVRNEDQSDNLIEADFDLSELRLNTDVRVHGLLQSNGFGSSAVRFAELDSNDEVHLRHSASDVDEIGIFARSGESDWDLHLLQGGDRERVFTTADDGSFDAATLAGEDAAYYATLTENETVAGAWTYDDTLTASAGVNTDTITPSTELTVGGDLNVTGTFEIGGDTIATQTWVDGQLVDIDNSGSSVADSVGLLNFGNDLGVTDDGSGQVTIDYVGAEIPSYVYEDGTEVLADANGIDFLNDFTVTAGTNSVAEIELNVPDDLASTSTDETVTGAWTFSSAATFGTVDVGGVLRDGSATERLDLGETITATGDLTVSGDASVTNASASGQIDEQGDRVATRTWTTGELDTLESTIRGDVAELGVDETVTGSWTFDNPIDATENYQLGGNRVVHLGTDLYLGEVDDTGASSVRIRVGGSGHVLEATDTAVDINGVDLTERGDRVATRTWTTGELDTLESDVRADVAEVNANETITASWSFGTDVELAFGDGDDYRWRHSAASGDLVLDAMETNADTAIRVHGDGTLGALAVDGLTIGGTDAATTADLFSGSYTDLSNVPSTFDPEVHGNGSHTLTFATEDYVDNAVSGGELSASADETISGSWTFSSAVNLDTYIEYQGGSRILFDANTTTFNSDLETLDNVIASGGSFSSNVTIDGSATVDGGIEVGAPITTSGGLYAVIGDEEIEVQINGTDGNGILNIKTN